MVPLMVDSTLTLEAVLTSEVVLISTLEAVLVVLLMEPLILLAEPLALLEEPLMADSTLLEMLLEPLEVLFWRSLPFNDYIKKAGKNTM